MITVTPNRMTAREYRLHMGLPTDGQASAPAGKSSGSKKAQIRLPRPAKQNAGELEFMHMLQAEYAGCRVLAFPFSLICPSGCRYTPDLVVLAGAQILLVVEVKGRRIHNGHSIRAFKEAAAAFPFWQFLFAQKMEGGRWSRCFGAEPSVAN